jgi:hypothetical protein
MKRRKVAYRKPAPRVENGVDHRDGRHVGVAHDGESENIHAVVFGRGVSFSSVSLHLMGFGGLNGGERLTMVGDDGLHRGAVISRSVLIVVPMVEQSFSDCCL